MFSLPIHLIDCHVARPSRQNFGEFEYLALRRASKKIYAGQWRIVTGKIEQSESAWQAAKREVKEETQFDNFRFFVIPFVSSFYEWESDHLHSIPVFLALVNQDIDPILNDEHCDFRWCLIEEIVDLLDWPAQRNGVRAAEMFLKSREELINSLEIL
ncbi:MAG: NUDIX domain-containing protein [Chloroflexi bacterium]|nr:NUDIX domain-containing protein [Chloroflexota bacterium]|tara:strand:+ start:148 stop:618 length:471 start_codon:yes stop_codon:yes gene_type:complete